MQSHNDIKIIKYILSNINTTNNIQKYNIDFEKIKHIIDKFEDITGCKLYNKLHLLKDIEIDKNYYMSTLIEAINKNMIPEITFNSMFRSNLDFILIFKENEIIILYKNIKVELAKLTDIKIDLLTNKINYLPVIAELYVNNIIIIIEKLINKDISVKYHLTEIPIPYWNLFEIKCKKTNSNLLKQLTKYKYLDDIISGKIYESTKEEINSEQNENKELDENDNYYRMEIMSYLNDKEIIYFLKKLEDIEKNEQTLQITVSDSITNHLRLLLDILSSTPNIMIKYYMVNKTFNFILKIKDYLVKYTIFRNTISNKINELQDDIYVIETTGLKFSKEIINTFENCKNCIDNIEKSLNPSYISKWHNYNLHNSKNQNNKINKINKYKKNNKYIDEDNKIV
jgi:hypothetical protein